MPQVVVVSMPTVNVYIYLYLYISLISVNSQVFLSNDFCYVVFLDFLSRKSGYVKMKGTIGQIKFKNFYAIYQIH